MPNYNLGRAVGQVDIDSRGLKDADLTLREAGRGLLYTGGALVAGFGYVVKTAADFEKQMDFVAAINQETAESMELLREEALRLGRRGPYGPNEVAASFVELAKAGVDAETIIGGVGDATVSLAAAADIGLVESTEILVNTLKTFDLQAKDAVKTVDIIAGAANASTIDVDDFAYSMRYAGSIAAALDVPLKDVATALAVLGDRGIKGSTGGTSLRRVLLNLQPASAKAGEALKELGIITEDGTNRFFDSEGSAKSLSDVFQILGDSLDGLTDADKVKAVNAIFGARAAPSALILAGQGAEGFEKYAAAIDRVSASDVAEQRLDNLAGAVLKLKAALEATFITAGTPFQKMLQGWVEAITAVVVWFGELDPRIQSFILGAVGVVGVLSLMAGAFLLTIGNIVRAIRVFGQLAGLFNVVSGAGRAAGGLSLLGKALAFLVTPMGLVVLAIIAIVAAFIYFYTTSETFREFINSIPEKIVEAWNAIVDFFKGPFVDAIKDAWNAVKEFFSDIGGFFGDIGSTIGGAASSIGGFFSDLFGSIAGISTGAFNGVTGFFESLANIDIGGTFADGIGAVADFAGDLPGLLSGAVSSAADAFLGFLFDLPGKIGYALGFAIGRFIKFHIDLVKLMVDLGVKLVKAVIEWGSKIIVAMVSWITELSVKMALWVIEMVGKAIELGTQFLVAIVTFFSQLPGIIASFLLGVLTAIVAAIPGIVAGGAQLGLDFLTSVVNFVMQLPGRVIGFLTDVVSAVWNAIPGILAAAMDFGSNLLNGIIDIITDLPGLVWDILWRVIDAFTDMVQQAYNAAKSFAGGLWDGFKDGLGISSPSFIERALFAVEEQAVVTAANLNSAVRQINAQASKLPTVTSGLPEAILPASAASTSSTQTTQVIDNTHNGPLIGVAHIREEQDIPKLAKELHKLKVNQERGKGVSR